jgi:AmmeMemoRadiSam system protein A
MKRPSIMSLTDVERRHLLERARNAIAAAVGVPPAQRQSAGPSLTHRAGAFVTLRLGSHLRGCIGYPAPDLPLVAVVERCAVSAALSDPRFPALDPSELSEIALEISVLGAIQPVKDISEVEVGRHGLIAQLGARRGLLLPQVAREWEWDREAFAAQTCQKAGLPPDAWKHGAQLFTFEADVFGEET